MSDKQHLEIHLRTAEKLDNLLRILREMVDEITTETDGIKERLEFLEKVKPKGWSP